MRNWNWLLILVLANSVAFGSDLWVTHYPDSDSTQIWIDAADFGSKTADFQEDTAASDTLSRHAYYFPNYDGPSTFQPWWAEYTIAAVDVPGVTLDGKTWYFWARASQPISGAEESDVVFVKGDPGDGTGGSWYDDALATVDVATDRILNDLASVGGVGAWVWCSTETESVVSKEFNLDENNEIVFRISERESGLANARIDAMMWTDDPNFVPADSDYLGTSLYGIRQVYDGRDAGEIPHIFWTAQDGYGQDAIINGEGPGSDKPIYYPVEGGGGYDFSYTLDALDHNSDSGSIVDLGQEFLPDYDDDFSVEVWFRADGCPAGNQQQVLWSTQSLAGNGMRLYIYDWSGASGKFGITLEARDNTGSKVQWATSDENGGDKYDYGQWMQVVAVYDAGAAGSGIPNMKIYTNGELKRDVDHTSAVPADTDFVDTVRGASSVLGARGVPNDIRFAANNDREYFDGGIALVQIFEKAASSSEILASYNENKLWIIDEAPYDPAVDLPFDGSNGVEIQSGLIFKLDAKSAGDLPHLACVNEQTGSTGGVESMGPSASLYLPEYYETVNGAGYELDYTTDSGGYLDLGNVLPDYDEPFTVEMWVRPDGMTSDCMQQALFSSQGLSANGARLAIADWDLDGKYSIVYEMRDNVGSKVNWNAWDENKDEYNVSQFYDVGEWIQIVAVYTPDATGLGWPNIRIYTNGELKLNKDCVSTLPTDYDFVEFGGQGQIGSRGKQSDTNTSSTNRHYFNGGFALIRMYEKVLSGAEVQSNYDYNKNEIIVNLPYDPSVDPVYTPPVILPKVSFSLVQEYDGRYPGVLSDVNWDPTVESVTGDIYSIGPLPRWPQHSVDAYYFSNAVNDSVEDPNSSGGGMELGDAFVPDYNDDFTVEIWVSPDEIPADNHQQVLWGTQGLSGNGMRLYVYDWSGTWEDWYGVAFEARDNSGEKAKYTVSASSVTQQHSEGWKQFVIAYDGATNKKPVMKMFVDGQPFSLASSNVNDPLPLDLDFKTVNARQMLGVHGFPEEAVTTAKDVRQYYQGGMALVRVYDRKLADSEILVNYNNDAGWVQSLATYNSAAFDLGLVPEITKADINGNRYIGLVDYSMLAYDWLASPVVNENADITGDGNVNVADLEKLAEYWLTEF